MCAFSKKIADRHFGVGADQVLIIAKSAKADFRMLIFNNDGSEVEMCGNGIRCLARYAYEKGLTDKKVITVDTPVGIKRVEILADKVKVDMGEPMLKTKDWCFEDERTVKRSLKVDEVSYKVTLISMGNPHCVVFRDRIDNLDLPKIGPSFENHECFPNRINTEFVKVRNKKEVDMRVWERGAGETLACGTGACAVCVASVLNNLTDRQITVHLSGGDLIVSWADDNHVYMTGSAEFVFEGNYGI
jgi:diaminopimelate epimerase